MKMNDKLTDIGRKKSKTQKKVAKSECAPLDANIAVRYMELRRLRESISEFESKLYHDE